MILDANLIFSKDQEVKASAVSTNVLDFQEGGDAVGQELTIRAVVTTAFAGLTGLQIKVQTSDDDTNYTDVLLTPSIVAAKLVRGAEILCVRVPRGLGRYARLSYVVTGTGTAGKITAYMSKEI